MSSGSKSSRNLKGNIKFSDANSRAKKMTFATDEHDLYDGEVKLLRTKQSGLVWQMRYWVSSEKRYVRKSTRCRDLDDAKAWAKNEYGKILGKLSSGQLVFSITASQLVDKYLSYQQSRVEQGLITKGRLGTMSSHLKHYVNFVGKDTSLDSIKGTKFLQYFLFRKQVSADVQDTTLVNERATIQHLHKFARTNGLINSEINMAKFEEMKKINVRSRDAFTREDYRTLYNFLTHYTKQAVDDEDKYYRQLVRDFILIKSNTGLRFGELQQLRWSDVTIMKKSAGQKYENCSLSVRAETSKTRSSRTAIGRRGDIFKRIKTYSEIENKGDFVFKAFNSSSMVNKKVLYKYWHLIMKESGLKETAGNRYTYYCLRHTFATWRLQFGKIDVYQLSKILGTSLVNIQKHYDGIKMEEMADYLMRDGEDDAIDAFVLAD